MPINNIQIVRFETVQAPDGGSMYMDLTLPNYMARVTVGQLDADRGYCDMEILNTETEETVEWQHQEFGSVAELNAALTGFFSRLRGLPDADISTGGTSFIFPLAGQNVRLNSLLAPLIAADGG